MFEKIETLTRNFYDEFQKNSLKVYLVAANVALVLFALVFSNTGMLPFRTSGDFVFFGVLALMLAIYRPGWSFLFFVGSLALENINLAPSFFNIALRPYQFMGLITIIAIAVGFLTKRLSFNLPKWRWPDILVLALVVSGFLSAFGSDNFGLSFKQAIVALSFAALYSVVRIYIQSAADLKRIAPFFISSGVIVGIYGIWQNVRFMHGEKSFEVMPGRPNATFTEADWLGIYLVFLLAVILTVIHESSKKSSVTSHQSSSQQAESVSSMTNDRLLMTNNFIKKALSYIFLVLIFITLILTVSRSAWIGAVIIILGFLKMTLFYGSENVAPGEQQKGFWHEILLTLKAEWNWRGFFKAFVMLLATITISVGIIYVFQLTNFQLGSRAVSTGGLQRITVACSRDEIVPQKIKDISELEKYGCRHINLEDIEKEKSAGSEILEVERPDPNVSLRAEIYRKSIAQIKAHPIFGIGWGSIGKILGTDERGAGLNASNIFLEVWLGTGLLGISAFVILLVYIFGLSCKNLVRSRGKDSSAVFLLLGLFAVVIPNLFNSGIFLGFVWVYLGVAVSLVGNGKTGKNI